MNTSDLRAEEFETSQDTIHNWPVRLVCYKVGNRYFASVESIDPGAQIARAESNSRDEALRHAREKAESRLARTRVL